MDRPSTSKPRGVCKYYTTPRGCFAGKNCKFLHGESETLTPFDKAKTCIYYTKGFCKHGDKCWFLHVDSPTGNPIAAEQDASQEDCSICLDTPSTYGLLSDCSHVFCLPCVRQWRDSQGKSEDVVESGNTKKCPLCRVTSRFIVPSSRFYPENHPGKAKVIEAYKESTKRIPCKYFQETKNSSSPICPFGSECFYAHINDDGTPYQFSGGASRWMSIYKRRNRPRVYLSDAWDPVDHFAIDLFHLFRNSDISATLESIRQRLPDLLPDAGRHEEDEESSQNERQNQIESAEEAQQRVPRGVTIPDMPASFSALNGNMIADHGTEEENMSLQRVLESIHGLYDDDDTYDDTYSPTSDVSMELALSESSYQDVSDSDDEAQLTPFLVDPSERTTRSLPSSPRRSASSISFDRPASRLSVSSLLEAGSFVQSLIDLNILVSRPATPPIVATPPTATATTADTGNATLPSTSSSLSSSTASHLSPPAAATAPSTAHTAFNSSPLSPHARPFTPASTLLRPAAAFATATSSLTITAPSSIGDGASGHYLRLPSPLPRSPRPSPPSPGRAFAGMDGESSMVIDLDEDDSVDDEVCEDTDGAGRSGAIDSGVLTVVAEDEGQQQRSAPPMVLVTATTTTPSTSASGAVPPAGQVSSPSPQGADENINSSSGNNIERRLAALHDSDPPFVTDGRGRVVWSRHGQQQQQQQQHRKSVINVNNNTRREGGVEPPVAVVVAATTVGSNDSSSNPGSSAQHAE